jgi:hypothetical protein
MYRRAPCEGSIQKMSEHRELHGKFKSPVRDWQIKSPQKVGMSGFDTSYVSRGVSYGAVQAQGASQMASSIDEFSTAGKLIYELIVEAQNEFRDRRSDVRFAFFRPVTVETDDGMKIEAFSREISASGIGLVHGQEMPKGEVEVHIFPEQGYAIRVRTQILWCQECGHGWYISGGRFAGTATVSK